MNLYVRTHCYNMDLLKRNELIKMNAARIIANAANSLSVKKFAREKGWTKAESVQKVTDYVYSGSKLSMYEWMKNA